MGMIHPSIEPPYLHAMAGHLLYQVDENGVVREKHFNGGAIGCIDVSIRRLNVEVLRALVVEAFVRNDGDAWMRTWINPQKGAPEYDVPILGRMRRVTEEETRGKVWPNEWIRTDRISLWYEGQRLTC